MNTNSQTRGDDGSMLISRAGTFRLIRTRIEERIPTAVVRFGEGEARLLAATPDDSTSVDLAVRKLGKQTGLAFSKSAMLKVRALILNALDQADVLGLHGSPRFSEEHREWMARLDEIYADRVAKGRKPAYVAHCLLHHDLYRAFPRVLEGQSRLSVISCRDVKPALNANYGIGDVAMYQTPSQYVVRDVDGAYEAKLHDIPIWPNFYDDLLSRIEVREEGEVFLIGVGLFGKDLCVRVRDLGGIALDMGSVLDAIAGKVTRGRNKPEFRPPPKTPRFV